VEGGEREKDEKDEKDEKKRRMKQGDKEIALPSEGGKDRRKGGSQGLNSERG
jgi:hypothetical protein